MAKSCHLVLVWYLSFCSNARNPPTCVWNRYLSPYNKLQQASKWDIFRTSNGKFPWLFFFTHWILTTKAGFWRSLVINVVVITWDESRSHDVTMRATGRDRQPLPGKHPWKLGNLKSNKGSCVLMHIGTGNLGYITWLAWSFSLNTTLFTRLCCGRRCCSCEWCSKVCFWVQRGWLGKPDGLILVYCLGFLGFEIAVHRPK